MSATYRLELLNRVYPPEVAAAISTRLEIALQATTFRPPAATTPDAPVWLISYPDQFQSDERSPLIELGRFIDGPLHGLVDGVHILPFYPWSSDGGFSVKDYDRVEPAYGSWADIESIAATNQVMFDAVINHMSTEGAWFQKFLAGDQEFQGFFRTADPEADTSSVVRPRTHPLLTPFRNGAGETIHVWTTFSADQADLDYANPEVLLRVISSLISYVRHGATAIRLDAIGFLWKDEATRSIHLPQTHDVIKLIRSALDDVAPGTILISETNVPHEENISYLAHDTPSEPEVQAVYQFPLATLVAHAVLTGDTTALVQWARGIDELVGPGHTFLNFLASHDGIGVRPAEGLLDPEAIQVLATACQESGGRISYRSLPDGSETPYELNTTWFDLMTHGVDEATAIKRHLATHAVMLALPGIAAIYVHSFVGSSNDRDAVIASGHNRDLNRRRFTDLDALHAKLSTPAGRERQVLDGLRALIAARNTSLAFHTEGESTILDAPNGVFAIQRDHDGHRAICLVNLSEERVEVPGHGELDPLQTLFVL